MIFHLSSLTQRRKETGPLLFLSLFLLLLAFFILLNSLSTLEETKAREIIDSLSSTFRENQPDQQSQEILITDFNQAQSSTDLLDDVQRLWSTQIPVTRLQSVTIGEANVLILPALELFVGGEAAVRGDRQELLGATARALALELGDATLQMDVTFSAERALAVAQLLEQAFPEKRAIINDAAPQQELDQLPPLQANGPGERAAISRDALSVQRAAAFAMFLKRAGVAADRYKIGLRLGTTGQVELRFFARDKERDHFTITPDLVGAAQ